MSVAVRHLTLRLAPLRAALAALAVLAVVAAPCQARDVESKEKAALETTIADFDAAMRDSKYDRVVAAIPPKVIANLAKKGGLEPEAMKTMVVSMMQAMMTDVKIEAFGMDVPKTEYKSLANGTPYALIPTRTVVAAKAAGRFEQKSHTLALIDDGKWYLVRVSEVAQLAIVKEVYPEFAGVEFPRGSMEVLK